MNRDLQHYTFFGRFLYMTYSDILSDSECNFIDEFSKENSNYMKLTPNYNIIKQKIKQKLSDFFNHFRVHKLKSKEYEKLNNIHNELDNLMIKYNGLQDSLSNSELMNNNLNDTILDYKNKYKFLSDLFNSLEEKNKNLLMIINDKDEQNTNLNEILKNKDIQISDTTLIEEKDRNILNLNSTINSTINSHNLIIESFELKQSEYENELQKLHNIIENLELEKLELINNINDLHIKNNNIITNYENENNKITLKLHLIQTENEKYKLMHDLYNLKLKIAESPYNWKTFFILLQIGIIILGSFFMKYL